MIEKIARSIRQEKPRDMKALVSFVASTEEQLGNLSDERAVLKSFEWPETKFDCFREATALYKELFGILKVYIQRLP